MKRKMNQLAIALAGKANWTWWAGRFPVGFQLEFDTSCAGVASEGQPLSRLAIAFYELTSVSFVEQLGAEKGWAYQLNSGEIASFGVTGKSFLFDTQQEVAQMVRMASRVNTIYGGKPEGIAFKTAQTQFGLWAGNVGIMVAAKSVRFFGMAGEITADALEFE